MTPWRARRSAGNLLKARRGFDKLDVNKDNVVDEAELARALKLLGVQAPSGWRCWPPELRCRL